MFTKLPSLTRIFVPKQATTMPFPWPHPHAKTPNPNPQNPLLSLQTHLDSLKSNLESALQSFANNASQALNSLLSPPTQSVTVKGSQSAVNGRRRDVIMTVADVEERLAGVPVYALSNSSEEFVLVSGRHTGKSLGFFCFKREDAESILKQMKAMNADVRDGSKVVALALNKVFQLKVDGVAFRFIPESSQVSNAIKEKEKVGELSNGFPGVPVFQSRSLVLRNRNKRYRPFFFRKEDLEDSLLKSSRQQGQLNPALGNGDIQVCVLEDIIKSMMESSASEWDDVVFIPPGFNMN